MGKSFTTSIEETMSYEGSGKTGLGMSGNRGPTKAKSRKKYASKSMAKKSKYIKPVKKDSPAKKPITPVKPLPIKPVAPIKKPGNVVAPPAKKKP